jgi:hypothetical protein
MQNWKTISLMCMLVGAVVACGDADTASELAPNEERAETGGTGGTGGSGAAASSGGQGGGQGGATFSASADVVWDSALADFGAGASSWVVAMSAAPDGSLYLVTFDNPGYALHRLDPDGSPSAGAWPRVVTLTASEDALLEGARPAVTSLPDGSVKVTGTGDFEGWGTEHISADGTLLATDNFISGPGSAPTGSLLDEQGRLTIFGLPGAYRGAPGDCLVARFEADGSLIDESIVNVSDATSPRVTHCRGVAATGGDLTVVGSVAIPQSNTHVIGAATVSLTGSVTLVTDDLVDPVGSSMRAYDVDAFADGTIIVGVSDTVIGATTSRQSLIGPGDIADNPWETGSSRLAVLDDSQLVAVARATLDRQLIIEIRQRTEDGLVTLAELPVAQSENGIFLQSVTAVGNDFYVAFRGGTPRIARIAVTPGPS